MSKVVRPVTIEDVLCSVDALSGHASTVLTTYVRSNPFTASASTLHDPHGYAHALLSADVAAIHALLKARRTELGHFQTAVSELYCLRWTPLELPIFTVILNLIYALPGKRREYLALAKYLIQDAKVPVDAVDVEGKSALMHALATQPFFDAAFATLLLVAPKKAKINRTDRHGRTAAHYIVDVTSSSTSSSTSMSLATDRQKADACRYFLANGGNLLIPDNTGESPMGVAFRIRGKAPMLADVLLGRDQQAKEEEERDEAVQMSPLYPNVGRTKGTGILMYPAEPSSSSRPTFPRSHTSTSDGQFQAQQSQSLISSAARPAFSRSKTAESQMSTASSGSNGSRRSNMDNARLMLPGVSCPCQRRGMWRVCCGVPPDMKALRTVVPGAEGSTAA